MDSWDKLTLAKKILETKVYRPNLQSTENNSLRAIAWILLVIAERMEGKNE